MRSSITRGGQAVVLRSLARSRGRFGGEFDRRSPGVSLTEREVAVCPISPPAFRRERLRGDGDPRGFAGRPRRGGGRRSGFRRGEGDFRGARSGDHAGRWCRVDAVEGDPASRANWRLRGSNRRCDAVGENDAGGTAAAFEDVPSGAAGGGSRPSARNAAARAGAKAAHRRAGPWCGWCLFKMGIERKQFAGDPA
jgi:hypothetical protein